MRKLLFGAVLGSTLVLCACETNHPKPEVAPVAAPAVTSATAAAAVLASAAVDAPIPGLPGAVWSDPNNTGYVTGYRYNGQFHPGLPPGYDLATHSVVKR
jgi:hypothetical protein